MAGSAGGWFRVMNDLVDARTWAGLSLPAKAVYVVLLRATNGNGAACWPSYDRLAELAGVSRRSAIASLADLERAGLVVCDRTPGLLNRYRLSRPAGGSTSAGDARVNDAEPVQEMHGTSAGDARVPVQEMHPKKTKRKRHRKKTGCNEPSGEVSSPPPAELSAHSFLTKTGKPWPLTKAKLDAYLLAFPLMDVDAELRKAALWCEDNPQRRKTERGMPRFVTTWLTRAHDTGRYARRTDAPDAPRRTESFEELAKRRGGIVAWPKPKGSTDANQPL